MDQQRATLAGHIQHQALEKSKDIPYQQQVQQSVRFYNGVGQNGCQRLFHRGGLAAVG
jgi:hypothetical protein